VAWAERGGREDWRIEGCGAVVCKRTLRANATETAMTGEEGGSGWLLDCAVLFVIRQFMIEERQLDEGNVPYTLRYHTFDTRQPDHEHIY
jgi:hypothetical protein